MSAPISSVKERQANIFLRAFALLYGIAAYFIFFAAFLYSVGFVGNLALPTTIDRGPIATPLQAACIDLMLLLLFAVQHSVMARPLFKRWWTRLIPASIERSTYVLLSSLALCLLFWQWRPIHGEIWMAVNPFTVGAVTALYWIGWTVALLSTFLLSHFEFFGLAQVLARFLNRKLPAPVLKTPLFYRYVRHPLYLGFLVAFWAAPTMTAGHLLFALATTGYILFAIQLEERDLIGTFGEEYRRYRRQVAMLIPIPGRNLAAGRRANASKFPSDRTAEIAVLQEPANGQQKRHA
jgi:protein-S-isoprenylcysteine O-methyltransferase Ste14